METRTKSEDEEEEGRRKRRGEIWAAEEVTGR
jgi:hypothetical protein